MDNKYFQLANNIENFNKDGRLLIQDIYNLYGDFLQKFKWDLQIVYEQQIEHNDGTFSKLPILCFTSPLKGKALWVLSGVHGEESAGPNAIAQSLEYIGKLGTEIPMVLFPLCNPLGYTKGWRYPNEYRDWKKGISVSDSEYLLPKTDTNLPVARAEKPAGPEAFAITQQVIKLINEYPPLLSIDHHEDEALEYSYIYSQGKLGVNDPVANTIVRIMQEAGTPLQTTGKTRFDEDVLNGIVLSAEDGSIDELLAAEKIVIDGKLEKGPAAKTTIVVETPVINVPLEKRIKAHKAIINNYLDLYRMSL